MDQLKIMKDKWNENLRPKCKESVKIESIDGLIIGPYSATFKRYLDLNIKDHILHDEKHD